MGNLPAVAVALYSERPGTTLTKTAAVAHCITDSCELWRMCGGDGNTVGSWSHDLIIMAGVTFHWPTFTKVVLGQLDCFADCDALGRVTVVIMTSACVSKQGK